MKLRMRKPHPLSLKRVGVVCTVHVHVGVLLKNITVKCGEGGGPETEVPLVVALVPYACT